MSQSRSLSLIEAAVNTSVGYGVAVLANVAVLPWFGLHPSLQESASIGLIFTVISLLRSFLLRRMFSSIRPHPRKSYIRSAAR